MMDTPNFSSQWVCRCDSAREKSIYQTKVSQNIYGAASVLATHPCLNNLLQIPLERSASSSLCSSSTLSYSLASASSSCCRSCSIVECVLLVNSSLVRSSA